VLLAISGVIAFSVLDVVSFKPNVAISLQSSTIVIICRLSVCLTRLCCDKTAESVDNA